VHSALFQGPGSLRDPSERLAFWLTALCALPAALLIGFLLHESIGASQVALFIVIAMIYVTLARGRLLGSSVRIHEAQYPRVFEIVKRTCVALEIPMPLIFVREDNLVPVAALGFGEPYSLVLSSHWIEVFEDDELAFMVGRELGHIAAGHTRFLSLLSVNGNENPLIALIFGAWLRRCSFTCDKVGLLCCGSIDAAIRAMGVAAFHRFGRRIDYRAFAEQHAEVAADPVLRWGAWLGSEPYATVRIASLRRFIETHAFAAAQEWFLRERDEEPPSMPAPGTTQVVDKDCAGWWRRAAAYTIDSIVVTAIISSFGGHPIVINQRDAFAPVQIDVNDRPHARHTTPSPAASPAGSAAKAVPAAMEASPSPTASDEDETIGPVHIDDNGVTIAPARTTGLDLDEIGKIIGDLGIYLWLPMYLAILVAVAGQTFGMMITGLRVVTVDFRRPGVARTILRYAIEGLLFLPIMAMSLIWRRILLHDRLTGTRVVKVERILARAAGSLTR
jgi:hypothetical protein